MFYFGVDMMTCQCGHNYFLSPELFEVHSTDPLVVECLECGKMMRMDCQGITCQECPLECEGKGDREE